MPMSRTHAHLRLIAALSLALFVNATTIAPAFHQHEGLHDPARCLLCLLQVSGVWAPAPEATMPAVGVSSSEPPADSHLYLPTGVVCAPLARGPPVR